MDKVKASLGVFISFIILVSVGIVVLYFMLYPIKYKDEVLLSAQEYELNPALLFSIINAESSFNKNAVSKAGAMGLMQLMPKTAEELASKLNMSDFKTEDLYNPSVNIRLGSAYLKLLMDKFGSLNTAICAYNAGPNKVTLWLDDSEFSLDGKTLLNTPYPATNIYLKKVLDNLNKYSKFFH